MDDRLFDMINHLEEQYCPAPDGSPYGPRVTWAEMQLVQIIKLLAAKVDNLEKHLVRSIVGPGVDISNIGLADESGVAK